MTATVQLNITQMTEGQASAEVTVNTALLVLDAFARLGVKDRDLATPPASPTDGDRYIVATGGTGAWSGKDGYVSVSLSGAWVSIAPREGWRAWVDDEDTMVTYDGSAWVEHATGRITTGITASTTQTQGQGALTAALNVVATCANANDTVTLPAAYKGRVCTITNQGAQTAKVYPASGDSIDALAVNTSTTIAAAARKRFEAVDSTKWYTTSS